MMAKRQSYAAFSDTTLLIYSVFVRGMWSPLETRANLST